YDATVSATITGCTLTGILSPDTVNCDFLGASASFSDKHIGTGKTVTGSGFSLTGPDAGNYAITTIDTTTADISAKGVTVDFATSSKVYDGNTAATIIGCTLTGVALGDTVSCDFSGATATFSDKN